MPDLKDLMDVDGDTVDDQFSDESSFYGDEDTKADYEEQIASFEPASWWEKDHFPLNTLAETNRVDAIAHEKQADLRDAPEPNLPLHNEFEGEEYAKQLPESVDEFIQRLPPKTTLVSTATWLWVSNPYNSKSRRTHQSDFKDAGEEILGTFEARRKELEKQNPGSARSAITRKMSKERNGLPEKILEKAREFNILSGKWMLFVSGDRVNEVWHTIVKATAAGELGCTSKVATNDGQGRYHVICIYNDDFADRKEVERVLMRLVELKLVSKTDKMGIFYKCDAYTHLGIDSTNEYGLRASMYSSKELLNNK